MKKTILALLVASVATLGVANAKLSLATDKGVTLSLAGEVNFAYIKQSKSVTDADKNVSTAHQNFFGVNDYAGDNKLTFNISRNFDPETVLSATIRVNLRNGASSYADRTFIKFDNQTFGQFFIGRIDREDFAYSYEDGEASILDQQVLEFDSHTTKNLKKADGDYPRLFTSLAYVSPSFNGIKAFGFVNLPTTTDNDKRTRSYQLGLGYNRDLTSDLAYQVTLKNTLKTTSQFNTKGVRPVDQYSRNIALSQQISSEQYRTDLFLGIEQERSNAQFAETGVYDLSNIITVGIQHKLAQVPVSFYGQYITEDAKTLVKATKTTSPTKLFTVGTSYAFNDYAFVYLEGGKLTNKTVTKTFSNGESVTSDKASGKAVAIGLNLSF